MYEDFFVKLAEECEIRSRSANTARTYTDNVKRFLIDVLSVEEVEQMINTAAGIRSKALIALIYSSGLSLNKDKQPVSSYFSL